MKGLYRTRLKLKVTQRRLAKAAGVNQGTISRVECGEVIPRSSTVTKINRGISKIESCRS